MNRLTKAIVAVLVLYSVTVLVLQSSTLSLPTMYLHSSQLVPTTVPEETWMNVGVSAFGGIYGYGWSGLENGEHGQWRWSDGHSATLAFPKQPVDKAALLTLRLQGAQVGDRKAGPVTVMVNGTVVETLHLEAAIQEYPVVIPAEVHRGLPIIVVLGIEETIQPKEFGIGDDTRQLGAAIYGVKISHQSAE